MTLLTFVQKSRYREMGLTKKKLNTSINGEIFQNRYLYYANVLFVITDIIMFKISIYEYSQIKSSYKVINKFNNYDAINITTGVKLLMT